MIGKVIYGDRMNKISLWFRSFLCKRVLKECNEREENFTRIITEIMNDCTKEMSRLEDELKSKDEIINELETRLQIAKSNQK